jgi:hypothetical protein
MKALRDNVVSNAGLVGKHRDRNQKLHVQKHTAAEEQRGRRA